LKQKKQATRNNKKMKQIDIEVKWNNTCCNSICPVTQEEHKPFFGMYPFLAGTWDPVSYDAIVESDPLAASKI
jgi:hypothetical protein